MITSIQSPACHQTRNALQTASLTITNAFAPVSEPAPECAPWRSIDPHAPSRETEKNAIAADLPRRRARRHRLPQEKAVSTYELYLNAKMSE